MEINPSGKINAASTGAESSANGLSTPRLLDVNGDGTVDFVYAGDLRGNIWKFDVSNVDASNWKVAFSTAGCTACTPFYTAVEKANTANRQPITSAPNLRPNVTVGGFMVVFGTGRNVTEGDRTDVTVQTLYSILDNTRYKLDTVAGPNLGKVVIDTSASYTSCHRNERTGHQTGRACFQRTSHCRARHQ